MKTCFVRHILVKPIGGKITLLLSCIIMHESETMSNGTAKDVSLLSEELHQMNKHLLS